MKEEAKQVIETMASYPKASMGITAMFTSNVWLDYGEPIIKGLTSFLGLTILVLLIIKHVLDIKKEHFTRRIDKKDDLS